MLSVVVTIICGGHRISEYFLSLASPVCFPLSALVCLLIGYPSSTHCVFYALTPGQTFHVSSKISSIFCRFLFHSTPTLTQQRSSCSVHVHFFYLHLRFTFFRFSPLPTRVKKNCACSILNFCPSFRSISFFLFNRLLFHQTICCHFFRTLAATSWITQLTFFIAKCFSIAVHCAALHCFYVSSSD